MTRIYVHGLGQTPASWEKTAAALNVDGDILCPDLAGLLRGREASYQNLYLAFSDLCGCAAGPVDLCGLSLGGVLALNYGLEHPERVNSLVLIAAQYKMPKRLLQFQNLLFRFMPKSMFQQTGFGKAEFLHLCETMKELDFTQALSGISCPVLVVCGEKDSANRSASEELARSLKHAQLQVIGAAGHEVNVDAPEKLAQALHDFYSRI